MRAALFVLLSILIFELILGTTYLYQQKKSLPLPEPQSALFGLVPPQPVKALKEILTYQTTPLSYPSQGIILRIEGDMLLAHVNKTYALPPWYVPPSLTSLNDELKTIGPEVIRKAIFPDLKALLAATKKSCGCELAVLSAYRSFQTQVEVYNWWVSQVGRYYADLGAARPGHSEHQLGTTVDLTSSTVGYQLTRNFGFTCEGIWLENNAWRYGFVLSYPKGKESVTSYIWEPWHFRHVGKAVAQEIYRKGITLEEYLSSR